MVVIYDLCTECRQLNAYRHGKMYECSQCHRLSPIASRDDIDGDMCIDCKLDEEDQLIIRDAEN
jgi:hypothetical protein